MTTLFFIIVIYLIFELCLKPIADNRIIISEKLTNQIHMSSTKRRAIVKACNKLNFNIDNVKVCKNDTGSAYTVGNIVYLNEKVFADNRITSKMLASMVAHEVGHIRQKHTGETFVFNLISNTLIIGALSVILYLNIPLYYLISTFVPLYLIKIMILKSLQRNQELRADTYSANHLNKESRIKCIQTFSGKHKVGIFSSHPSYNSRMWNIIQK